ncbi:potassium/proton antiporter [Thalassospiraceae bacterium LMO-SO8]|nr:potassium/proton antiporter [Alphaproteobacteria bacterium LMO-S08]WND75554.1 potassium/proton antiporter [Thalassospiraceae bacterium LMO-SO8]
MEFSNHLILIGSALILVSIVAGTLSSRFGAPLLLVFLVLGMLAGEDGPGGLKFNDYEATYLVGSIALAVILFDGGLRTRWKDFRGVGAPAAVLATAGVLITAALTGVAARFLLGVPWLEGLLIGSIVASTDAAAVFLLLSARAMRLRERLGAVLEAEAGLNDPMAVLLTVTCVGLILSTDPSLSVDTATIVAGRFALQIVGGLLAGLIGGYVLLAALNGLTIASGLYPVLAASGALLLFAGAQEIGASGFLAVYIAGLVVGNRRHKATLLINRFHDGLAWLCQIIMFLILGLLITPSSLIPVILPAVAIAAALMFVARPVAVGLSLAAFRYPAREIAFVSWVGLRGAVPIFLGTIPVIAGVDDAETYFGVVYIVVMASLIVQGWSVGTVGRRLGVLLAPRPAQPPRVEIDLPSDVGKDMTAYTVQARSLALRRDLARLPLPENIDVVSIIRDGILRTPADVERLAPGDDVILLAPPDQAVALDRLFGARQPGQNDPDTVGEFSFDAETSLGAIADAYDFWIPGNRRETPVGDFLRRNLLRAPLAGRRLHLVSVELIVRRMENGRIVTVGIELDPVAGRWRRLFDLTKVWLESRLGRG